MILKEAKAAAKLVLMIAATAAFAACSDGGSGNGGGVSATEQAQAADLQGTWQSNCQDASLFGLTESSRLAIEGLSATQVTTVSSAGECASPSVEVIQAARLTKGGETAPNVRAIDIAISQIRVRPLSESGVAILNLSAFCNISDWVVNVERDVTGATGSDRCFPKVPTTIFEIYSIEDNRLFFGRGDGATSPSDRPVELNRDRVFTKQ